MQRLFMICMISIFICLTTDAQVIEKGSWMMEGQAYFDRNINTQLGPFYELISQGEVDYSAGLFLTPRLLAQLGVSVQATTFRNVSDQFINVLTRPKLGLTYYLNSDQPTPLKYFFTASTSFDTYIISGFNNIFRDRPLKIGFYFGPGMDYLLNNNIVLSTKFVFQRNPTNSFSSFDTQNNLILTSTLRVLFNRSNKNAVNDEQLRAFANVGDLIIGGTDLAFNLGWNSAYIFFVSSDQINKFNFSISPRIGLFMSKRMVVGTGLTIGYFNQAYTTTRTFAGTTGQSISMREALETRQVSLGFSPFARLYINVLKPSRFRYFTEFNINLLRVNHRSLQLGYRQFSNYITTLNLVLGSDIMLSDRIALEIMLNGQVYRNRSTDSESVNRTALGLRLGFQYFLTNN